MASSYYPKVVTSGLAVYFDAANRSSYPGSGTVWSDLSGNRRNATFVSSPTFSSNAQGTFNLDGVDDYIATSNITLNYPAGYTVEVVMRYNTIAGAQGLFGYNDDVNLKYINFYKASNQMRFETNSSQFILSSTILTADTWYHFAGVYNGTTAFLYINGRLDASGNLTSSTSMTAPMQIGRHATCTNGSISLARFYTRPLAQIDILQNFNATRGRFGV